MRSNERIKKSASWTAILFGPDDLIALGRFFASITPTRNSEEPKLLSSSARPSWIPADPEDQISHAFRPTGAKGRGHARPHESRRAGSRLSDLVDS